MKTRHEIIFGDARDMRETADESVHLVVTSPPYWQLKDYGHPRQIGFDDSYETYINHLNLVWKECHRALQPGCRLVVNIGDQFARSVYYGRYKIIPIREEIIRFCETIGFDYMGAVIWQKTTTMNTSGGGSVMGSFPYPRNGILKLDYEFILIFKKHGRAPEPTRRMKIASKLSTEEWSTYFAGHWNFAGEKQNGHLAMFPEELPRRVIRMFSFMGDTVLDPFLGSGTTALAAKNLHRNSIGYEINPDYRPVIARRLGLDAPRLDENAEVLFKRRASGTRDWPSEIARLPYVFRDPVKMDKKTDPHRLTFGSKITGKERKTHDLYSARRVEAADCMELNTGLKVRLLGVKPLPHKKESAVSFLSGATKNQKVFLRFDNGAKHDAENNPLAYVYLKNKMFLNAHLIKRGFAAPDVALDCRFKRRFMEYAGMVK